MTEVLLVEATDAFTSVAVRGRLDAAGVGEVDLKLTSQTVARRKPAIIDLTEVSFIASLGIGMLVAIARSLRSHGVGVAVVAGPHVRKILEMTNVGSLVPVVATREEALLALDVA
jgi:anti-sigma B factor antagonist